ncbi:hypothetical protein KTR9_2744 [Gordonia sp. KTR9]|nr:hypothetical protein KTR9_2744 [Gordonia sp. KTR9]
MSSTSSTRRAGDGASRGPAGRYTSRMADPRSFASMITCSSSTATSVWRFWVLGSAHSICWARTLCCTG